MGINFSKFSQEIQDKIKAALEDAKSPNKIDAEEFRAMNLEKDVANKLMQELCGNREYLGDGYIKMQNKNKILILLDKPEDNSFVPLTKDSLDYYHTHYGKDEITQGIYKDGMIYLADSKGRLVKDRFGNFICEKVSVREYAEETDNVEGSFEIIENEPTERTNRRFAIALIRSMYMEVINELQTIISQMGVLDAGLWREALGMGFQALADLKENQQAITATSKKKIERIEAERDNICNSLNDLLDSPDEFEEKFHRLVGKDYRNNVFEELRDIQHNQEDKASKTKFKECAARFKELYPDNKISENIEVWEDSIDYQQTVDQIANIIVMFVMTGGIGKIFQGSVQIMAKEILLAAAKGDKKAVMANFAKLAPEVQTVWKSMANREFGVLAAQTVTPMAQSAATMGSWEGLKAFLNNLTNAEQMSPEELLKRTVEGFLGGVEMGVVMGGLETFAIAPAMVKLAPVLNKLSGASAEISGLIEKGNGVVSMEKVMGVYTKASETLRGKIVKEGAHTLVALPTFTVGFTVTDTAFHYDEAEFRKQLLEAATTDEEREAVNKMSSVDLRLEFAKKDFEGQVKGMMTIEGVGLMFRRLQAGRLAAQSMNQRQRDILGANLRPVKENGKTVYEICKKEGDVIPVKNKDKTITRFSSIEQATAAYTVLCANVYAEISALFEEEQKQSKTDKKEDVSDIQLESEKEAAHSSDTKPAEEKKYNIKFYQRFLKPLPENGKIQKSYGNDQNSGYDVYLDASGNIIQKVNYHDRKNNVVSSVEQADYNADGKEVEHRLYYDGKLQSAAKYKYDSNGNRTRVESFDENGIKLAETINEYDIHNQEVRSRHYEYGRLLTDYIKVRLSDGTEKVYDRVQDVMEITKPNGEKETIRNYSGTKPQNPVSSRKLPKQSIAKINTKEDLFEFFKTNFNFVDEQKSMFDSLSDQQVKDLREVMLIGCNKLSSIKDFNKFAVVIAFANIESIDVIKAALTEPSSKEHLLDARIDNRVEFLMEKDGNRIKKLKELMELRKNCKNPLLSNINNILYLSMIPSIVYKTFEFKESDGSYSVDENNFNDFKQAHLIQILDGLNHPSPKTVVKMLQKVQYANGMVKYVRELLASNPMIQAEELNMEYLKRLSNEIIETYKPERSAYSDEKEYNRDLRFYNYLRDYVKSNNLEDLRTFVVYVPKQDKAKDSKREEIKQKLLNGKPLTGKNIGDTKEKSAIEKKQNTIRKDLYENNLNKVRNDIEITFRDVKDEHIRQIVEEKLKQVDSSDMTKYKKLCEYLDIQEIIDIYNNTTGLYTTVEDLYKTLPYYKEFLDYCKEKNHKTLKAITQNYSAFEKVVNEFVKFISVRVRNAGEVFNSKSLKKFNTYYKNICADFQEELRIQTLRKYCKNNNDELGDYMYTDVYLKSSTIPEKIKQQCAEIHQKFGVKVFVPFNAPEDTRILDFVKKELQVWVDTSNGQAKLPPTIDFLTAKEDYTRSVGGFCESYTSGAISLRGFDMTATVWALRHEITHANDTKLQNEFPDGIKSEKLVKNKKGETVTKVDLENCKYVDEFRAGGISDAHIAYAYTNPIEFIAVASEGDMSKYSTEFKEVLLSFGLPKWVLDMPPSKERLGRFANKKSRAADKKVQYTEQKTNTEKERKVSENEMSSEAEELTTVDEDRVEIYHSANGKDLVLVDGRFNKQPDDYVKIGNKLFEVKPDDAAENPEKIAEIKQDIENLRKTEPQKAEELEIILQMFTNPTGVQDVTDSQIDAVVNYLNSHYDILENYLTKQADGIGISDKELGRFGHRIKGEWSTRDKIVNYINNAKEKNKPKTLLDAYKDVRDKYASRTVFKKGDYSNHPEIVKILEEGNYSDEAYRKAVLRAAELQSEPAFKMLLEAMRRAKEEGKDLSMLRISNYYSEDGIPIFSPKQIKQLKFEGAQLGIDVEFIKLAVEIDPKAKTEFVDGAANKKQPSGYTALQINFVTKTGEIIEWQYRGELVNLFAEAEHLPYDLRTGKHPWRQYPVLEDLYKPIADLLSEKAMPKHAYKQLNKYFTDYYTYLRKLELGFEAKEPKLEDYEHYKAKDENGVEREYTFKFDKRLEAKNLMKLHEVADKVKDKDNPMTKEQGIKEYEEFLKNQGEPSSNTKETVNLEVVDINDVHELTALANELYQNAINPSLNAEYIVNSVKYKYQIPMLKALMECTYKSWYKDELKHIDAFEILNIMPKLKTMEDVEKVISLYHEYAPKRQNYKTLIENFDSPYFELMEKIFKTTDIKNADILIQEFDTPEKIQQAIKEYDNLMPSVKWSDKDVIIELSKRINGFDYNANEAALKTGVDSRYGEGTYEKYIKGSFTIASKAKNPAQQRLINEILELRNESYFIYAKMNRFDIDYAINRVIDCVQTYEDVKSIMSIFKARVAEYEGERHGVILDFVYDLDIVFEQMKNHKEIFNYIVGKKGAFYSSDGLVETLKYLQNIKNSEVLAEIKKYYTGDNLYHIKDFIDMANDPYKFEAIKFINEYNKNQKADKKIDIMKTDSRHTSPVEYITDESSLNYFKMIVKTYKTNNQERLSYLMEIANNDFKRQAVKMLLSYKNKDGSGIINASTPIERVINMIENDSDIQKLSDIFSKKKFYFFERTLTFKDVIDEMQQNPNTKTYLKTLKEKYPYVDSQKVLQYVKDDSDFELALKFLEKDRNWDLYYIPEARKNPDIKKALEYILKTNVSLLDYLGRNILTMRNAYERVKALNESGISSIPDKVLPELKNSKFLTKAYLKDNSKFLNAIRVNHFTKDTPQAEMLEKVPVGEVCTIDKALHIRVDNKFIKMNISLRTYLKLFPTRDKFDTRQGGAGDCWLISTIDVLMSTPAGRAKLLELFSEKDGTVYVTLPGKEPIPFNDGKPYAEGEYGAHAHACDGIRLLEEAVGFACAEKKPEYVSSQTDLQDMMRHHLEGGDEEKGFKLLLGKGGDIPSIRSSELFESILLKYNNNQSVVLGTGVNKNVNIPKTIYDEYGLVSGHAYRIDGYNEKTKTVYVVNPHDTKFSIEIPLDVYTTYFNVIKIYEIKD